MLGQAKLAFFILQIGDIADWVMLLTLESHPNLYELIITERDIEPMSSSSSPAGSGDTVHICRRITDQPYVFTEVQYSIEHVLNAY